MSREARPWVIITAVLAVAALVAWRASRRWLESDEFMTAIAGGVLHWITLLLALATAVAAFITWRLRSDPD